MKQSSGCLQPRAARVMCPQFWGRVVTGGVLLFCALSLEGCTEMHNGQLVFLRDIPRVDGYLAIGNVRIPEHKMPFWRKKKDYFKTFAHADPKTKQLSFNSCMNKEVGGFDTCSGRGACMPWDPEDLSNPLLFCKCQKGWAGPECNKKRKSQAVAWAYSLFIGWTGADLFYLGWPYYATTKMLVSGLGLCVTAFVSPNLGAPFFAGWWLIDIVRIGSAQVYAHDYRVAADLPRWAFSVFSFLFMTLLGFGLSAASIFWVVTGKRRKADEALLMTGKYL
jgi:TM2 domain-containing membrane protein YozV